MMAGKGHGGRPISWISVGIIMIGFAVGGVALCLGPNWLVFWIGVGICAVGGIIALATDIFSDVIVDEPRVLPEESHSSPRGSEDQSRRGEPSDDQRSLPTIGEGQPNL
ncbi:HGxxPAAW family protein [Bailinhaonella thermotolerans]|uniref:HGxxPAAW family protein n=1 Tax=Bailinhaonella thermotolerans TaxID=1070861 RepID=UPI00192A1D01|nr:HGxxPAAW family protein [Bailinhaonella thermotolerans]